MTKVSFKIGQDVVTNTYTTVDRYLVMLQDIQAYMVRFFEFQAIPEGDTVKVKLFWKNKDRVYLLPHEAANIVSDAVQDREFRIKIISQQPD